MHSRSAAVAGGRARRSRGSCCWSSCIGAGPSCEESRTTTSHCSTGMQCARPCTRQLAHQNVPETCDKHRAHRCPTFAASIRALLGKGQSSMHCCLSILLPCSHGTTHSMMSLRRQHTTTHNNHLLAACSACNLPPPPHLLGRAAGHTNACLSTCQLS